MHGDAAFAGQGITAETLNYADLPAYTVGGTLHVIVNNLIGFTTTPNELHTSRFAAQIARRQDCPIFHVNGEDVDAVVRVARMAVEYRYTFGSDVIVDLIGYRRHGHSEVDDPTITQPLLYKAISGHPPLWEIYANDVGIEDVQARVQAVRESYEAAQKRLGTFAKSPPCASCRSIGTSTPAGGIRQSMKSKLDCLWMRLPQSGSASPVIPKASTFIPRSRSCWNIAPKWLGVNARWITAWLRRWPSKPGENRDSGSAEWTGQPRAGPSTNGIRYLLTSKTSRNMCRCSTSRQARRAARSLTQLYPKPECLGFEYGYSRDYPEALVLWEAQFGDFANVAQAVIDQFVSSGEDKWNLLSGVVLLLPHGYEGQGPEHSSARIERFLQLAARDNFQICQPSNAAQYFHLLRRQALRVWRKPLVVFTPKSMLRHPDAASPVADLTHKQFSPVLPDVGAEMQAGSYFAPARSGTNCAWNEKNGKTIPSQ